MARKRFRRKGLGIFAPVAILALLSGGSVAAASYTVTVESEWTFTLDEAKTVYIYGNSNRACNEPGTDPYLWLYNSGGSLVAQDDDGNHNSIDQCVSSKIVTNLNAGSYMIRAGYCCSQRTLGTNPYGNGSTYELIISDLELDGGPATTTTTVPTTTTSTTTTTTTTSTTSTSTTTTTSTTSTTTTLPPTTTTSTTSTTTIPSTTTTTEVPPSTSTTTSTTAPPTTTTTVSPSTTTSTTSTLPSPPLAPPAGSTTGSPQPVVTTPPPTTAAPTSTSSTTTSTTTTTTTTTLPPTTTTTTLAPTTTTSPPTTTTIPPTTSTTSVPSGTTTTTVGTTTSTTVQPTTTTSPPTTSSLPPTTTTATEVQVFEEEKPVISVEPIPENEVRAPVVAKTTPEKSAKASEAIQYIADDELAGEVFTVVASEEVTVEDVQELVTNDNFDEIPPEAKEAIAIALSDQPNEVKDTFEAEVNVFEGGFDEYVPADSTVPVKTRRVLVVATTAAFVLPAPSSRSKP